MTIFKMKAKMGSCAFCHKKFIVDVQDHRNSDDILYDNVLRRAFHPTCPPEVMPQSKSEIENKSYDIKSGVSRENKTSDIRPAIHNEVKQRGDLVATKTKTDVIESQVLPELLDLFDGKFAIPCELEGEKTHLSIRIATRKNGKFVGSRVIQAHFGRHDGRAFIPVAYIPKESKKLFYYKSFLHETEMPENKKEVVRQAIKMLLEGTENPAYALEYARICRRCWHCNLPLVNIKSLEDLDKNGGLGPICVSKYPELLLKIQSSVISEPKVIYYS